MKTGIIGLPQVGKTSLFKILTKAKTEGFGHSREAHIGIARVPDARLDKLAALAGTRKTVYATVEYADLAAIGEDALKETSFLTSLRNVDAIIHVLRAFEDETIPHVGPIDPLRDIGNVEIELIVSDLGQIEKRLERVARDMKKQKTAELEREHALLLRCKAQTEAEKPLREMELTAEEKKLVRGFVFLSQKPILYVLNISESTTLGADVEAAVAKYGLAEAASRPNSGRNRDLRQGGGRTGRDGGRRGGGVSGGLRPDGERAGAAHPQELRAARPGELLHHWRAGDARLDDPRQLPRAGGCGGDPLRSGEVLHPRRDDPLGHIAGGGIGGGSAGAGNAPAGRQGLSRKGWRCAEHSP